MFLCVTVGCKSLRMAGNRTPQPALVGRSCEPRGEDWPSKHTSRSRVGATFATETVTSSAGLSRDVTRWRSSGYGNRPMLADQFIACSRWKTRCSLSRGVKRSKKYEETEGEENKRETNRIEERRREEETKRRAETERVVSCSTWE